MAPAAQAPVKRATYDRSRPRFQSLEAWLKVYGNAEYAIYKRDAGPSPLSYEDWTSSEHVLGPFLWYTTLDVWEETSSSNEESDLEAPTFISRGPPEQPKKSVTTNGHGKNRAGKSSTSALQSKSEDAAAAAKRKRKPKKPYLSEDIVVSDVSDGVEGPAPAIETLPLASSVSASPANGRRKSGGRRKKQFLSAEIISPEDEEEDPVAMNRVVAAAAYRREPSAPVEHHAPVVATPEPLKAKSGRKPKRKHSSQATVPKDVDDHFDDPADDVVTPKNAAASPEGPGSSSSRRGLRTRTPAQQRPYFHHAQAFEELVSEPEAHNSTKPSPNAKTRLKLTNLAQSSYPEEAEEEIENEIETLLDEEDEDDAMLDFEEPQPVKKAHYKGKGRAWKKTSEDEDEDFIAPAKNRAPNQPKRKLARRKSTQTQQVLAKELEHEVFEEQQQQDEIVEEQIESTVHSPVQKGGKQKRKQRRVHHLSEEFVRDDSDTAPEEQQKLAMVKRPIITSPAKHAPKKGRGRPRKSDQNSIPKETINPKADDKLESPGKERSPPKTETPKNKVAETVTFNISRLEERGPGPNSSQYETIAPAPGSSDYETMAPGPDSSPPAKRTDEHV
ncbi:hypothetical protein N0V90_002791 [Kalmusia sp. IMI 367209]|nr:hypothetical protein N0V90_002791 [Kalmusia sp. IMI 367209]